jgi:tetraacyldisaccharide 4'-kinase
LPAGPLRESTTRLREVDFLVCNGGEPQQGEIPMDLQGDQAQRLGAGAESRKLSDFSGSTVHAVAAIGNPQRFFESLREHGMKVIEHAFADHHALKQADLDFGDSLDVLMTEKDAVKCSSFALPHHWCVPVQAVVPEQFLMALERMLRCAISECTTRN